MSYEYEIWLKEPDGTTIQAIPDWQKINYQWATNSIGTLTLDIPLEYWSLFDANSDGKPDRDMRLDIYRAVDGGVFSLLFDTCCFVRHYTRVRDTRTLSVRAKTANTLLARRIVAARPGTDQAYKSDNVASIIHEVVEEQMTNGGLLSISERDWSAQLDFGTAVAFTPDIGRSFAYDNVLEVCKRLADASWELGTYLAFDIVVDAASTGGLLLKTYSGQRGANRISSITLGVNFGNVEPTTDTVDYENEVSVSYIGGPGEGPYRQVEAASIDTLATAAGPYWGLIEHFHSATQQQGILAIANEAFTQLRERRELQRFGVRVLDVPGYQFGVDYSAGDRVTLYDDLGGTEYVVRIDQVGIAVDSTNEAIDIKMEVET